MIIWLAELLSIILSVPIVHHCFQSFISIVFSSFRCSPNHHWLLSLALLAFVEVFETENTIKKPVSFFESYRQSSKILAWGKASFKGLLYNFIIILSLMHYKGLLYIAQLWTCSWPPHFFKAWLLFGTIPTSVVCCLRHFCLHLILHPPSLMANEEKKKNQCLFCKIATNDYLQSSERVKNVRPHTHKLFNDFAKKMCPCIGPHLFYGLAWQSCYIFKEKLLEYNMQSKKEKERNVWIFLPFFLCV